MVLEEAANTSPESFADDTPASDPDRFSSDSPQFESSNNKDISAQNGGQTYKIDDSKLPKVWGPFGPTAIQGSRFRGLQDQIALAHSILQRPLRQDEVDAFAYHFAHSMRVASFGMPVGTAIGLVQATRTYNKFRFPFWQPKENSWFNPDKLGPVTGPRARLLWHTFRFSAYTTVGTFIATIFFSSYAISADMAARYQDPRLKDFHDSVRQRAKEGKLTNPLQQRRGQANPITTQAGGMDAQIQKAHGVLDRSSGRQAQNNTSDDDMSPTSGAWAQDNGRSSTDTGLLSDDQMRREERRQRVGADTSSTGRRDSTFDMDNLTSQSQRSNDDASPQSNQQSSASQYPPGSAWERIRREANAGKGQPQSQSQDRRQGRPAWERDVQHEQRQGSTVGESFSFSNADEDRQLAKSEAQKEFDARVERERSGGDFDESRRGRKW